MSTRKTIGIPTSKLFKIESIFKWKWKRKTEGKKKIKREKKEENIDIQFFLCFRYIMQYRFFFFFSSHFIIIFLRSMIVYVLRLRDMPGAIQFFSRNYEANENIIFILIFLSLTKFNFITFSFSPNSEMKA